MPQPDLRKPCSLAAPNRYLEVYRLAEGPHPGEPVRDPDWFHATVSRRYSAFGACRACQGGRQMRVHRNVHCRPRCQLAWPSWWRKYDIATRSGEGPGRCGGERRRRWRDWAEEFRCAGLAVQDRLLGVHGPRCRWTCKCLFFLGKTTSPCS